MLLPICIPLKTVSEGNASQREHWSVKHRRHKAQSTETTLALRCAWGPMVGTWTTPCTITLTRIAPRVLDGDNLQGALKYVRDAVARWLKLDDADQLLIWAYAQRPGGVRTYAVIIHLEEDP